MVFKDNKNICEYKLKVSCDLLVEELTFYFLKH